NQPYSTTTFTTYLLPLVTTERKYTPAGWSSFMFFASLVSMLNSFIFSPTIFVRVSIACSVTDDDAKTVNIPLLGFGYTIIPLSAPLIFCMPTFVIIVTSE